MANPGACCNLGNMYKFGNGVTQSYLNAIDLYKKDCDGGSLKGCHNLAVMFLTGDGVDQNIFY